ncbi:hypothetical protein OEZ85_007767 [Tetradesmus obliquus]|uniref:SGNH hydrolase-type esterase domain-containing protein n=1 Tax=Tetradesmus obliquus TaxID=3088 RepID=A0ABY8TH71_TETOB|nr:hypothetical protein OEZ85_007767 [Tetradesmus obliquus]
MVGPDWLLRKGLTNKLDGRNWQRLAAKLATPGSNITVVVFGGSVSTGYGLPQRSANWGSQFCTWLQSAFQHTNIIQVNMARDATNVDLAEACWYQHTPEEADLVMIEYNLNACGYFTCSSIVAPQIVAYESLMRKLIRKVPDAALLAFDVFSFETFDVALPNGRGTRKLNAPYYNSGEEMHAMLATRYSVPLISARNALYDVMWNDKALSSIFGATRKELLQDTKHPTMQGHALYGRGLVAWGARQMLAPELQALAAGGAAAPARAALLGPVSPLAAQVDGDSWCAEGSSLQSHVIATSSSLGPGAQDAHRTADADAMSSNGAPVNAAAQFVPWQLVESNITQKCELPNCASLGYQAKGRGMQLDLQLDLSAAKSPGETLNRRAVSVFFSVGALFLPDTGSRGESIGLGQMSCERGCTCEPMLLDGFRPGRSASTKANSTEVLGGPTCHVRITIKDQNWVRVQAVAVVPYTNALLRTPVDISAMRAFYNSNSTPRPLGHKRRLQGRS